MVSGCALTLDVLIMFLLPCHVWQGRLLRVGKEVLELILQSLQSPALKATHPSHVFCWISVDGPWIPGLPSLKLAGPLAQLVLHWRLSEELHNLLRPVSLRAQHVQRWQPTWSLVLSWLDNSSGTTTRLSLFCWTAGSVITKTQTFTHSIFHSQASWREAKLC